MAKCLVTKLNGSISNAGLLRLGEMRIKFNKVLSPSKNTQYLSINVSKPINLEIIGDGYFTDENLSANNGKTKTIGENTKVFVSNNTLELAILDKYNLVAIFDYDASNVKNKEFDIEAVSYSKKLTELNVRSVQLTGDISALKNLTALTTLSLDNNQLTGDISALKNLTALRYLFVQCTPLTGDISALKNLTALTTLLLANIQLTGDISALKNLTALTTLSLDNNQLTGDISALKNLTALRYLFVQCTPLTGDISALKNLTALTTLLLANIQLTGDISALKNLTALTIISMINVPGVFGNLSNLSQYVALRDINIQKATISGDIATLPSSVRFVSLAENKGTLTWSTRPTSYKIIALEGVTISNIDEMLINQANCQIGYDVSDYSFYKVISVSGTRTSASDAAVAILQQKGYTISIAKA